LLLPLLQAIAKTAAARILFLRWLRHLGGPGLILLGLVDNSIIPLPGSMDIFVIVLAADQPHWWPYYAFMATLGAEIGGYLTYRLARGEGQGRLAKRLRRSQMEKVHSTFEKWGVLAVAVPAMIPPPFPMTPFLIAAGAAQYSLHKFLTALFVGRAVRYAILASLAALYGRAIIGFLAQHTRVAVWVSIFLMLATIAFALLRAKFGSSREKHESDGREGRHATQPQPSPAQK
jgi:membrane protein YqaA with SNARE-associated domain